MWEEDSAAAVGALPVAAPLSHFAKLPHTLATLALCHTQVAKRHPHSIPSLSAIALRPENKSLPIAER